MPSRRAIAIGNYDFRSSGTVAKSIEIATAAAAAGLPAELWVMRASGPLRERVPDNVPVIEAGDRNRFHANRAVDLGLGIKSLSAALRHRRPSVFLSGGNHLHLPARLALAISGHRNEIRYGVRASNSSSRSTRNGYNGKMPLWDRAKYQSADFVVAVSRELAQEIGRSLPSVDIELIPNGVDIDRVRSRGKESFTHPFFAKPRRKQPVIIAMGRICPQKGFDILIKALACLASDICPTLLVIGDGPKREIMKLSALARDHNVADRIDFLGYMANPFAVMSKGDLFVSSSRWEGASNALNEALICGLPVVATDCPTGNREALRDGRYGTLVPTNDPEAMAKGILAELSVGPRDGMETLATELDLKLRLDQWVQLLTHQSEQANRRLCI